eukprot:scaffold5159_cov112-Cylindrotheca_fusiformis.AAC.18
MTRIFVPLLALISTVHCFVIPQPSDNSVTTLRAKSKGFGAKETPKANPKKESSESSSIVDNVSEKSPMTAQPFPEQQEGDLSQGKKALEKMRRERAEQRNAELQKIKELKDVDAMLQDSSEAAVIPEKVAQRMGNRMLPFVGIPLFGSMAAFVGFWYMATYKDLEFQPALVAGSTIIILAVGLVGITYSIMSTSWDPDREGSALGTEEFSKNVENIKQGLSRSRDNAVLRDRMSEYSPEEIENFGKKDASKEKRQQSFSDKFGDDLE